MIRKTLVECAQSLVKGNVYAKKSQRLKSRQKGMDVNIIALFLGTFRSINFWYFFFKRSVALSAYAIIFTSIPF